MNEPFGFMEETIIFLSNKLKIQFIAYSKQINWPQKCRKFQKKKKIFQNNLIEMTIIQLFINFSMWLFPCQQLTLIKMKIYFVLTGRCGHGSPCEQVSISNNKSYRFFFLLYSLIKYVFDKSFIICFRLIT